MSAAATRPATAAEEREKFERLRLSVAMRLAAGMLANPATYQMQSWEASVSSISVRLADRIIAANRIE